MSSEISLTVYNPITNHEVIIQLIEGKASHEDTALGYISKPQLLVIPPGIYKTPKIPITYASNGIGAQLLKDALNGELDVDSYALMKVWVGWFEMDILYESSGVDTKIRL
ncbi:unnamed protein product [Ambrosiozyma monospora]|uniref:Unnamed protein product n=1 Tax=Ambrosiozyma monospora TaxID=43982 RepID=A0ACB5T8V5_AMBMO|nr:unnamed protein product [Ambrosiozyma monospora]